MYVNLNEVKWKHKKNTQKNFLFCYNSVGSTGSTGSESDCQSLHGGICVQQNFISVKDCNIAKEALEILVTCLQLRSELIGNYVSLFKTAGITICGKYRSCNLNLKMISKTQNDSHDVINA